MTAPSDDRADGARAVRRSPPPAGRLTRAAVAMAALLASTVVPRIAQTQGVIDSVARAPGTPLPFAAGEVAAYAISFGPLHVGSGSMTVAGIDTVRGRIAWHAVFLMNGGTLFFKVHDRIESWFDTTSLASLRFAQTIREGRYHADRLFEIYPERATYVRAGKGERSSVRQPLDDASFLYFLRTLPLEVGRRYELRRYFQPEGNPVVIRVVRREQVRVPAGTFNTVVVQPQITTQGMFAKDGHAEVWVADDSTHLIVQVKSQLSFGSINLYLSEYTRGVGVRATRGGG